MHGKTSLGLFDFQFLIRECERTIASGGALLVKLPMAADIRQSRTNCSYWDGEEQTNNEDNDFSHGNLFDH